MSTSSECVSAIAPDPIGVTRDQVDVSWRVVLPMCLAACADGMLHGRATVDADGRPLAGAYVVVDASDGRHVAPTDDDGRFAVALPPGQWPSELHVAGGIYAPWHLVGDPSSNAGVECTSCSPLLHPKCPRDSSITQLAPGDAETLNALALQRVELFRAQVADANLLPDSGPIWLVDGREHQHDRLVVPWGYHLTTVKALKREAARQRASVRFVFVSDVEVGDGCAHVSVGIAMATPPGVTPQCCCTTDSLWTRRCGEWLYVGDERATCS
jgi:hypothetical protein